MQFTQDSVSQYYAGTLSAADRDGHWPANHIVPTEVASILSSKDFDGVIPSGSGSPSYGFGGPLPSYKLKGRNTLSKMLCLLNVYCCYFQSNCQICMLRVSSHLDSTSSYYRSGDIVYISSKITILTWVQLPGSVFYRDTPVLGASRALVSANGLLLFLPRTGTQVLQVCLLDIQSIQPLGQYTKLVLPEWLCTYSISSTKFHR